MEDILSTYGFGRVYGELGYTDNCYIYNDELYKVSVSSNKIFWEKFENQKWSARFKIPIAIDAYKEFVSACVFRDKLYIFYLANDPDKKRMHYATFDGKNWNVDIKIPAKSNYKPAPCVFKNNLYLLFKGAHSNKLMFCKFDGDNWVVNQEINEDPESNLQPEVCVYKNSLYMVYKGAHSDKLYYARFDGQNWSVNNVISHGPELEYTPRIRIFNDKLYLVYDGEKAINMILARCPSHDCHDLRNLKSKDNGQALFSLLSSSANCIYLFSNNFGSYGGEALAAALLKREFLKKFHLSSYAFGDEIGDKFLDAVMRSTSLDEIVLTNCGISQHILEKMNSFLSTRQKLMKDFMDAIKQGNIKSVKYYLTQGASLSYRNDTDGNTALHDAVKYGHKNIIRYLLCQNASVTLLNIHGKSPLEIAREEKHDDIIRLLQQNVSSWKKILEKIDQAEDEYNKAIEYKQNGELQQAENHLVIAESIYKNIEKEEGEKCEAQIKLVMKLINKIKLKKLLKEAKEMCAKAEEAIENKKYLEAEKLYLLAKEMYDKLEHEGQDHKLRQKLIGVQLDNLKLKATSTNSSNSSPTLNVFSQHTDSGLINNNENISSSSLLPSLYIPKAQLKLAQELGSGSFGIVYKGMWLSKNVAIKQLQLTALPVKLLEDFRKEINIMKNFHCPSVVMLYGVTQEEPYSMVMEYMDRGSLRDVLDTTKPQNLAWNLRLNMAKDITAGLVYLHHRNFIHGDIKSLNILVNSKNEAKLADFGLTTLKIETASRVYSQTKMPSQTNKPKGSLLWMAPELFKRGSKANFQTDIYSYGMVLWELTSHEFPFKDARGEESIIKDWVKEGEREKFSDDVPKGYQILVQQSWDGDPSKRPTAEQALKLLEDIVIESSTAEFVPLNKPDDKQQQPSEGYLGNDYNSSVNSYAASSRHGFFASSLISSKNLSSDPSIATSNSNSVSLGKK